MARRRSTSRGIYPTGDANIDTVQQQLSEQIDGVSVEDLGEIVSVSLDGTASGTATLKSEKFLVLTKNAAAHIYITSGSTIRSDSNVKATLLVL